MPTLVEPAPAAAVPPRAVRPPPERIAIGCDDVPAALREKFAEPLKRALAGRSGGYRVQFGAGRNPREIVVTITAPDRRLPLCLFFPEAETLSAGEIERIVRNVLEGMGPAFR